MKKLILGTMILSLCLVACGSDEEEPYTWGDLSLELGTAYCNTISKCGFYVSDTTICADHTAWHMCEPDMSCDIEIDREAAAVALETCVEALNFLQPEDEGCYVIGFYGYVPQECDAIFELRPEVESDAGTEE